MSQTASLTAYFREVSITPLLSRREEKDLFHRVRRGDQSARNEAAKANQRLVIKIARQWLGRGLPFDDLIGEGNVGLMRAIDKFDASRNCRFATYAIYWIRQSIARGIQEKAHTVRLPLDLAGQVRRYRRSVDHIAREMGRQPCKSEVARRLRVPRSKLDRLDRAERALQGAVPLSDFGAVDTVQSGHDSDHGRSWLREIEARDILAVLARAITERERDVLCLRYGLDGRRPMTLEEVGRIHNVTRARIGQIEKRAIEKMSAEAGMAPGRTARSKTA